MLYLDNDKWLFSQPTTSTRLKCHNQAIFTFIQTCFYHKMLYYCKTIMISADFTWLKSLVSDQVLHYRNKVWSNDTIAALPPIFPSIAYFPKQYLYPPELWRLIHPWFIGRLFSLVVIQPSHIHPSSTPPSPSPVSDPSQLCERKGFCVGDGCLKRGENETHEYICPNTCGLTHAHTFTNKHESILHEAVVWWTAPAFGRRHDKVAARSRRGRASSVWMVRDEEGWEE